VGISYEEVGQILRLIDELDCESVTLEVGDLKLHVSRSGSAAPAAPAAPAAQAAPPEPAAAEDAAPAEAAAPAAEDAGVPAGWVPVKAAMVGTFYRAPAPGEPPFAEVGDTVAAGQQVAILEVMKLMNEVTAEVDGRVARIDAENGEAVDHGSALMWIEPPG
jgi:acetyl-CoA carboxylase biotin carboxyl carrier protein